MNDRIAQLEEQYRETYMGFYRHIHAHPETGYQEKETSEFVYSILKDMPLDEIRTNVGGYGIVAVLKGEHDGPCVALRADMDALNITEKTGCPFASQNAGIMHACGHDSHTSMLLAAAYVLSSMKDEIYGTVKFIFQPAEEMSPTGGAPAMIRDGALENPKVDAIVGMHVWPTLPTGVIGLQAGAVSAASDRLKMTVYGKTCHASMPDMGADAIVGTSAVIMSLQPIISRNLCPRNTAVISVCAIKGGEKHNIICDRVDLDGTVRSFDEEDHKKLPVWIERAIKNTAAAYGCTAELNYQVGYPSTVNNPQLVEIGRNVIKETFGDTALAPELPAAAIGEDFSFYTLQVPAAFTWLGCRPDDVKPEDMPALHNNTFMPDPKAFPYGVRYMASMALKLLKSELPEAKK